MSEYASARCNYWCNCCLCICVRVYLRVTLGHQLWRDQPSACLVLVSEVSYGMMIAYRDQMNFVTEFMYLRDTFTWGRCTKHPASSTVYGSHLSYIWTTNTQTCTPTHKDITRIERQGRRVHTEKFSSHLLNIWFIHFLFCYFYLIYWVNAELSWPELNVK